MQIVGGERDSDVYLAEGPWPNEAYEGALKRDHLRVHAPYAIHESPIISAGPYVQNLAPSDAVGHEPTHINTPPVDVESSEQDVQLEEDPPPMPTR